MTTHTDPRRICARAAAICLLASAFLLLPGRASAQWATNGNDINTTNTGNVGIGTTTPANGKVEITSDTGVADGEHSLLYASKSGTSSGGFRFGYRADGTNVTGGFLRSLNNLPLFIGTTGNPLALTVTNTGFFGFGTTSPWAKFVFSNNAATPPAPQDGTLFHLVNADGVKTRLNIDSFGLGAEPSVTFRFARGTAAAPSAILAGDSIGVIHGTGFGATAFLTAAKPGVRFYATENWTDAAAGSAVSFWTTANGTNVSAERMRIGNNGYVGIGTSNPGSHLFLGTGTPPVATLPGINVALGPSSGSYITATNDTVSTFLGADGSAYGIVGTLSNHPLGLRANNTLAMTISTAGNVGIGTASPAQKLDVAGNVNGSGLCIAGDCKTAWSQVGGGGSSQWTTSGSNVYYNTGNVGIGTTAPGARLHVNGTTLSGISAGTSSEYNARSLMLTARPLNDGVASLGFDSNGAYRGAFDFNGGNGSLVWYANGGSGWSPNLAVAANGNVGIGVTNPASNLQVGSQTSSPTAAPSSLSLGGTYSSTAGTNFKLKLYDDGIAANTYGIGVSAASMDFGVNSTAGYNWYSGGTHKMALNGSGSLGVGTNAPERRLHVLGGSIESQWSTTAGQGYGFFIARDNNHIVENAYFTGTEWRAIKAGKAAIFQTYTGGGYAFYIQSDDTSRAAEASRSFSPIFVVKTDGKVGMGTTTPGAAYKLDVVGSVNSSGLCIAGDCKTAWSQVGGTSQWTTSSSNIYFNTGNVGIGTTSPRGALEVGGGPLFLGDMGNAAWGNMVVRGRVISATNNIHLSPPGGTSVYINSDYREAGGAAGPVNLNVSGDVIVGGNISAKYQDVAEWVPSTQKLQAGTVVVLDKSASNHVVSSSKPYDTKVAGVVSDSPGVILGAGGEGKLKVATTGRVKVRVDASRGAIEVGDLLVTSDVEGVAMKSVPVDLGGTPIHRPGTIIGKALEPLEKGVGEILVLLSLQ